MIAALRDFAATFGHYRCGVEPMPTPNRCPSMVRRTVACAVAAGLLGIGPASGQALQTASLMLMWSPQAQFAGYYMAEQRGIFVRHGVKIRIVPGGPGLAPETALRTGEVDFALMWLGTALEQHAAGTPLVHLAQVVSRSSMLLVTRSDSGIHRIEDMAGRKVGLWGGSLAVPAQTLFTQRGVRVREVLQFHTLNLFLRGGVDVASAMSYNELHTLVNAGLNPGELRVFSLHDEGVRFAEDGLYTLRSTLQRDPALVRAMVQAIAEGWRHAFAHPEEALDLVLERMRAARLSANRVHQRWMLSRMKELIEPALASPPFHLPLADFNATALALVRAKRLAYHPPYADFVHQAAVAR